MVDATKQGVWIIELEGRTAFVNNLMAELLGCSPGEMLGRVHIDFMWEEDRPKGDEDMERRRQGTWEAWDQRYRRKDGTELWTLASCNSLFDGEVEPTFPRANARDICHPCRIWTRFLS